MIRPLLFVGVLLLCGLEGQAVADHHNACQPACASACEPDCVNVCPPPTSGVLGLRAVRAKNRYINTMNRQLMFMKIRAAIQECRNSRARLMFSSNYDMKPSKCHKPCQPPPCHPPIAEKPCAELEPIKVPVTINGVVCIPAMKVPAVIGMEPVVDPQAELVPTLAPPLPEPE